MRIYVASSRHNIEQTKTFMASLKLAGHIITYDWTAAIERNPPDDECSDDTLRDEALADYRGVVGAQLVVILATDSGGTGVWVEMGMALGAAVAVAYIGPFRTIFQYLARVTCFPTVDDFRKSLSPY